MKKPKRQLERFALRVTPNGCFAPADATTSARLREKRYRVNDLVFAEFKKPRNPRFHRLAHQLGILCTENIEAFEGMDAHRVLKRLQLEAQIGCDEMAIIVPGVGKCLHQTPRSLSFESMDEAEFKTVIAGFCRHIAKQYWPSLTADEIESMAGVMIND